MVDSRSKYGYRVRSACKAVEAYEAELQTACSSKPRVLEAMHCLKYVSMFIFFVCCFLASSVPASAQAASNPAYVQQCNAVEYWNTTSVSCTLNGVTAGDTIVVGTGGVTTSVTSTAGTFTNVVIGNGVAAYILANVPAGNITITANQSTYSGLQLSATEYNNVAASPLDGSASGQCTSYCTSVSTNTFTTTSNSDTLWAFCANYGGSTITAGTAPVVWTARPTPSGSGLVTFNEDGPTTSAGNYYGQCTGANWIVSLALKPAGSGSSSPAATPTFSPGAGTYTSAQTVTIGDATTGATIYYTTDGTTPTTSSAAYSAPISVSSSKTVKAIATASGYTQSAVGTAAYVINLPATPTYVQQCNAVEDWNTTSVSCTLNGVTAGDTIVVGTGGGAATSVTSTAGTFNNVVTGNGVAAYILPNVSGGNITITANQSAYTNLQLSAMEYNNVATSPLDGSASGQCNGYCTSVATDNFTTTSSSDTLWAFCTAYGGYTISAGTAPVVWTARPTPNGSGLATFNEDGSTTSAGSYYGECTGALWMVSLALKPAGSGGSSPAATPTFSPGAGTYTSAQTVTISDSTSGATIYYTTDGSTPTTSSVVYSGPITVSSSETVKAIATASGYTQSAVGTAAYTINQTSAAATPTFSPTAGTYSSAQTVTISDATSGATIYYTTDGTTPTTSSAVYSAPITVSSSETVNAIATASGYSQSIAGAAAYTIGSGSSSLTNGTYMIQNLTSGMVLDGGGVGTSKGTWVVQDNSTGGSNQQWTVTGLGNNTYEIVSGANGLSLDDYADATANGTEVDVYTNGAAQGNTGQIWYVTATSNGYYTLKTQDIVNAGVNSCIEPSGGSTASGAQIVINDGCDTPSGAQQWKFVPVTAAPPPVANGTYEIKNLASGMVLDGGASGTTPGTWIVQDASSNGTNQAWTVNGSGNAYTILGVADGLSLDDYGDATANGSEIDAWTINGSSGQIWYLTSTTNGYFTITSQDMAQAGPGTCIEPSGGSTASGAQIVINNGCDTPTSAEQWTFVPISGLNTAPATPTFSPGAGTYNIQVSVAINSATPGATIYYTTDGTTPTTSSPVYSSPISVTASETLKAIATATGYAQQSAVGSAAYTITYVTSSPTFSPAEGTYNSPQSVSISESAPGATIYYTTDGTTPTTESSVYSSPIDVTSSETIEAMAAAPGYTSSEPTLATYTISNGSAGNCSGMTVGDSASGTASLNGITPFPATNLWNVNIANAPVDPINATAQANAEYAGFTTRVNFGSSAGDGGIPFVIVDSSTTPLVPINVTDDVQDSDVVPAPYPTNIPIEGGFADCSGWPNNYQGDSHALILDRHTCWLYETYPTFHCNGQYAVGIETIWDIANGGMRPWGRTSTDAAGLSVFAGLVRYDEAASGHINHAIRVTVPHTRGAGPSTGAFVEPATHGAGNNSNAIPVEGMRMRLKSSFDISGYSQINQAILTAMKQYGLIVADNGGFDIRIIGATDSRWNDADLANLSGISSSNFEIVQMSPAYPGWIASTAPKGSAPTISSFTASETEVSSGSPVTFNFNVSNDSYDYIDVIGPVRTSYGSGSVTISPTATKQYTLYSINQYGQTKATPIIVTVPGSTIATPIFDQPGGTYTGAVGVVINTSTYPFAQIYYTTDGSTPTTSSPLYSGPVTVSGSETIKAIAVVPGYSGTSAVGSATYTIN